jgi:hypothetical protein
MPPKADRILQKLDPRWLVLVLPFALLAPVWLTGRALYWGTPSTQFMPWLWQAWRTLQGGEWPLWNPLLGMGAPLLANYQSAIFYLPNWLYFLLAALGGLPLMAWGQALVVAAHLAFAGWGMLRLLQRLKLSEFAQVVGALAFSLSGYLVARAHFLSINAAVAWLPWILVAAYDLAQPKSGWRSVLKLAFFLALQWLAGHAQISWYTLMLAAVWLLFWLSNNRSDIWRGVARFTLAALFAVALGAIQLLPTAEYLLQSQRATQCEAAAAMTYSFWPWRILTLLAPNLFGNPVAGNYVGYGNFWEDAVYIGLLPFLFAIAALFTKSNRRLVNFLWSLSLVSFLLAFGNNLPLFPWLFAHVPTFNLFQGPTRFTIWVAFALSLLAALTADCWRQPRRRQQYALRLGVAAAGALTAISATTFFINAFARIQTISIGLLFLGVFALACTILLLKTPPKLVPRSRWIWLALGLVTLDLIVAGWGLNPPGSLDFYKTLPTNQIDRVYMPAGDEYDLKFDQFFRFSSFETDQKALRASLLPNISVFDGLASANNFDPLLPVRYSAWIDVLESVNTETQTSMLAAMNVSDLLEHEGDRLVASQPVAALPRARWVGCAVSVSDSSEALQLVAAGQVDFARSVLLEGSGSPSCNDGGGSASITAESANAVSVAVRADSAGWLVLADTWFPGWLATVNGQPVEIVPAYGIFRAVEVGPEDSLVEFSYRPMSFTVGMITSALAWPTFVVIRKRLHA